jgi:CubicO group peptidase (beta-lactamase class C family)
VRAKGILFSGSAGRTAKDPAAPAWTEDTFTWLASMSKIITISACLKLVERGLIALDDEVHALAPELASLQILKGFTDEGKPILEANTKPVTFRHLLTHTSGFGYDLADPDLMRWSAAVNRTDNALTWNRGGFLTPLKFAPGEGWYYGSSTDWAGFVVEKVTGKTVGEYFSECIFEPLGMRSTGFRPKTMGVPDLEQRSATYAQRQVDGTLEDGKPEQPAEHEIESAGAGLYSTARDYAVFLKAFLKGDVVKPETMEEMFRLQLDGPQEDMLNMIATAWKIGFAPEFPDGLRLNHGIGGIINKEDSPGKRREGSMAWSGVCNSRWVRRAFSPFSLFPAALFFSFG